MIQTLLPAIEDQLQSAVQRVNGAGLEGLHAMMTYHMGWEGPGVGLEARGKRIRPLLVLLTSAAAGGEWRAALPAAAAVELIHNFSLIHDDIEDNSPLRRGRETLWKREGVAQAINTGDAMFTLAHLALLDLEQTVSPQAALRAERLLHATCLHLTQGQYMDIDYESRGDLTLEAYWPMVGGKTAALTAACTQLGAIAANAPEACIEAYARFGRGLGLAFQALDDLLGIWGDAALTGKSAESDLVSGKKSLPVLYGLAQGGTFARRWKEQRAASHPLQAEEVSALAELLAAEGAYDYTKEEANRLTDEALGALEEAGPQGEAGEELHQLARQLLQRQK